jgi:hypothetical protein
MPLSIIPAPYYVNDHSENLDGQLWDGGFGDLDLGF